MLRSSGGIGVVVLDRMRSYDPGAESHGLGSDQWVLWRRRRRRKRKRRKRGVRQRRRRERRRRGRRECGRRKRRRGRKGKREWGDQSLLLIQRCVWRWKVWLVCGVLEPGVRPKCVVE